MGQSIIHIQLTSSTPHTRAYIHTVLKVLRLRQSSGEIRIGDQKQTLFIQATAYIGKSLPDDDQYKRLKIDTRCQRQDYEKLLSQINL